ncbi:bifunctional oligoribonuclease/PAP phosphatase NrnA [Candidatus Margulisiibacteriota bacterium]
MQQVYKTIKVLIEESKTVLIAAHIDPDGDTLGSMIAMHLILEQLGKKSEMVAVSGLPESYQFLPRSEKIQKKPKRKEYDLLITVDSSDLTRLGKLDLKAKNIINIDHHPDNTNFGDINCVELLSSVAEQIYKLAKELRVEITQDIAVALYVAIMTDTGNFRYASTLPSTFHIAWELVEAGAVPWKIASAVYDVKTIAGMKVLAYALENMKVEKGGKFVWSAVPKSIVEKYGAKAEDLISIIDHLRAIKGSQVSVFMREDSTGKIKINFRSKGEVNVSKIANEIGGGGHIQAAGAQLDIPLAEAEEKVVATVLKNM